MLMGKSRGEDGSPVAETFGALLHAFRLRTGLAQNALARATGINVGTVNRLERDQRLPASRQQVLDLAAALALSMAETNRLLHAAGLPAEGFSPAITGNPTLCALVQVLQDDAIAPRDKEQLLLTLDHYVNLMARANGRAAGA
jgi:transcriptional regulator with XRE-family HTH domain